MSRRFKILIIMLWLLLLGLVALLQSGLLDQQSGAPGGNAWPLSSTKKKDKITMALGVIMGRWDEQVYRRVIENYNRMQDEVVVQPLLMPYATYLGKINIMLSTGQPPDVVLDAAMLAGRMVARSNMEDLSVPIPEAMFPQNLRQMYSPSFLASLGRGGKAYTFPTRLYLLGGTFTADRGWFDKAGIDLRPILENGWDYTEFREALRKVQDVMRREKGDQASAFAFNLAYVDKMLLQDLLPRVIGADAMNRYFLHYDARLGRYVLDPQIKAEDLAAPLQLMQQMLNTDQTWGKRTLGMDFGQIDDEVFVKQTIAIRCANMPADTMHSHAYWTQQYQQGLVDHLPQLTILPAPTPRKGMPQVFGAGADGWGVLKQIPYQGDEHTRQALKFARYMASPEVLAMLYREKGIREPYADLPRIMALSPGVNDPISNDPWQSYLWDECCANWQRSGHLYRQWSAWENDPQPRDLIALSTELDYWQNGYIAKEGHQLLEKVLYGQMAPLDAARQILAGIQQTIDQYYERHPDAAR